jgi:hypothetical protein
MSALAFTNYEPTVVQNTQGKACVQAVPVTEEQVLESIKAVGGNEKRRRSARVARLVSDALKSGDVCPD